MNTSLLITRTLAGVLLGVGMLAVFYYAWAVIDVDLWVPLVFGAIATSAVVAVVQITSGTTHYRSWSASTTRRFHGKVAYVVIQTPLGFPVIAAAAWVTAGVLVALLFADFDYY